MSDGGAGSKLKSPGKQKSLKDFFHRFTLPKYQPHPPADGAPAAQQTSPLRTLEGTASGQIARNGLGGDTSAVAGGESRAEPGTPKNERLLASNVTPGKRTSISNRSVVSISSDSTAASTPLASRKPSPSPALKRKFTPEPRGSDSNVFGEKQDAQSARRSKARRSTSSQEVLERADSSSSSVSMLSQTPVLSTPATSNQSNTRERNLVIRSSQEDENVDGVGANPAPSPTPRHYDSDSDSSLDDLDTVFAKRKLAGGQPLRTPSNTDTISNRKQRSTAFKGSYDIPRAFDMALEDRRLPTFKYKYSLGRLAKENITNLHAFEEMQRAKTILQEHDNEEPKTPNEVDPTLLATVVGGDESEDQVGKLMQAMHRAEVSNMEAVWSFFEDGTTEDFVAPEFPRLTADLHGRLSMLNDPEFRSQAFLTNLAAVLLSRTALPEDLGKWLWHASLLEPREDLAYSYMAVLGSSIGSEKLSLDWITDLFALLGAKSTALDPKASILARHRHSAHLRPGAYSRVVRILRVLSLLSRSFDAQAAETSLNILLRLGIDTEINDVESRMALQDCLENVIGSISAERLRACVARIGTNLFNSVSNVHLQLRLLNVIPCSKPALHDLRRRLAQAFFLSSDAPFKSATYSSTIADSISDTLQSSALYRLSEENVDYRAITSSIAILDIGIDSGFSNPSALLASSYTSDPLRSTAEVKAQVKAAVEEHNTAIDRISRCVYDIFSRIVDCGASHMARTDAKTVLERLLYRLDYGVRTTPRRKETVWNDDGAERIGAPSGTWAARGRGIMEDFVVKERSGERAVNDKNKDKDERATPATITSTSVAEEAQ